MKQRAVPLLLILTLPLLLLLASTAAAGRAPLASYTVNSADDLASDPGGCDAGHCSLREALMAANEAGGGNIYLDPPGDLINVTSPLPAVTGAVTLYGQDTTIHGGNNSGLFTVAAGGDLYADNLVLRNANAPEGAAFYNLGRLEILHSALVGNTAFLWGGAIYNAGEAFVRYARFQGNEASISGGAVENRGALTVERSTLDGNVSSAGGAIYSYGPTAVLTLTNSTLSGNAATSGGGLEVRGSEAYLHSNTIYRNANFGSTYAAGLQVASYAGATGRVALHNTVIGGSLDGGDDCVLAGTPLANRYNWIEDGTCQSGAVVGFRHGDPGLLPLADNGGVGTPLGALPTYAPAAGSGLLDAGTPDDCAGVDQRGTRRPQDGDADGSAGCDVGAFEAVYLALTAAVDGEGNLVLSWPGAFDWAYELECAVGAPAGFAPCAAANPVYDNSLTPSSTRPPLESALTDPATNVYYRVRAYSYGGESETVGAFTFALGGG